MEKFKRPMPTKFGTARIPASIEKRERKKIEKIPSAVELNLGPEFRTIYENNPHIRQVFLCNRPFKYKKVFTEYDRIINIDKAPKETYRERKEEFKTVTHIGQRKLLIMEIEFLTNWAEPGDIVIYAGAAHGGHHEILSLLFKDVLFLLYDPGDFIIEENYNKVIEPGTMITNRKIFKEFFTDSVANYLRNLYKENRILFISDIRRMDANLPDEEKDKSIKGDMESQMRWVQILNPTASLLKFRLLYTPGQMRYLDGFMYLQPWVGETSTETRLLVLDNHKFRLYDNTSNEQAMFYHNIHTRTTYYESIEDYDGKISCHCYDCVAELFILNKYAKKYNDKVDRLLNVINKKYYD